jgi:hypothetical protein
MKAIRFIILFVFLFLGELYSQGIQGDYYRLTKKADSLFKSKNYKASAFAYSEAFKSLGWKGMPEDRYNAACAWALAGYPDSAMFNLERMAYKMSFADIKRVSGEKHFKNLYSHRRWKPLLAEIKSNSDSIAAKEARLDKALIKKLDSLKREDQKWRNLSTRFHNNSIPKDSIDQLTISRNMRKTDSLNCIEARKIFYKYGFPNFDLVGEAGSGDFWLLMQHQDQVPSFQDSVLSAMKIEAEKGKASWRNYAYLIDRVKVNSDQLQIYGTQMQVNKENTSYEPKPVIEPEKLNERRKSVGLNTIEEYTEVMNKRYFGTLNKK